MERPYVFCHMLLSLDGKIMGKYMDTPEAEQAGEVFYNLAFGSAPHYKHQGWLSGRVTTDDNFTHYRAPALDESAAPVPEGDFVVETDAPMYYLSVDPSGKLGWEGNTLTYEGTTARVLEILTGRASGAYKALLRKLNIPYIIAGEETLDYAVALEKLKTLFGIHTLMLGGAVCSTGPSSRWACATSSASCWPRRQTARPTPPPCLKRAAFQATRPSALPCSMRRCKTAAACGCATR